MMRATMAQKRTLKLDGLAMSPEQQLTQPGINALSFEERLALLVDREVHCRSGRKLLRLLKNAHLKYGQAAIEDSDSMTRSDLLEMIDDRAAPGRRSLIVSCRLGIGIAGLATRPLPTRSLTTSCTQSTFHTDR